MHDTPIHQTNVSVCQRVFVHESAMVYSYWHSKHNKQCVCLSEDIFTWQSYSTPFIIDLAFINYIFVGQPGLHFVGQPFRGIAYISWGNLVYISWGNLFVGFTTKA